MNVRDLISCPCIRKGMEDHICLAKQVQKRGLHSQRDFRQPGLRRALRRAAISTLLSSIRKRKPLSQEPLRRTPLRQRLCTSHRRLLRHIRHMPLSQMQAAQMPAREHRGNRMPPLCRELRQMRSAVRQQMSLSARRASSVSSCRWIRWSRGFMRL